jgi:TPR repeat protein
LLLNAAAKGNVEAEINLAQLYELGQRGVRLDESQAVAWFEKACPTGLAVLAEDQARIKALIARKAEGAKMGKAFDAFTMALLADTQACAQDQLATHALSDMIRRSSLKKRKETSTGKNITLR